MKLLSVEQIFAGLRGDEAEVERLSRKRYPPPLPQPPEQVPEPMVQWRLPGQKKVVLITVREAAERFRVLTGEEFDVARWLAMHQGKRLE